MQPCGALEQLYTRPNRKHFTVVVAILTCFWVNCSEQTLVVHNNTISEPVLVDIYEVAVMPMRFCLQFPSPQFSTVL